METNELKVLKHVVDEEILEMRNESTEDIINRAMSFNNLGLMHENQGFFEEAEEMYMKCLQHSPRSSPTFSS